jgi:hypothetical protein
VRDGRLNDDIGAKAVTRRHSRSTEADKSSLRTTVHSMYISSHFRDGQNPPGQKRYRQEAEALSDRAWRNTLLPQRMMDLQVDRARMKIEACSAIQCIDRVLGNTTSLVSKDRLDMRVSNPPHDPKRSVIWSEAK